MLRGPQHHSILCPNSARIFFGIVFIMIKTLVLLGLVAFAKAQSYQPQLSSTYQHARTVNAYSAINIPASRQVAIVRQANDNNVDGSFVYGYETEDGQVAEARGQVQADGAEGIQSTQGSYAFTAPDGQRYTVSYNAGPNGFEAQGAHLPVAPPVPEAIAKALADNAADEARGIYDDGSYREVSNGQSANVGAAQVYQQGGFQQQVQQGVYQHSASGHFRV